MLPILVRCIILFSKSYMKLKLQKDYYYFYDYYPFLTVSMYLAYCANWGHCAKFLKYCRIFLQQNNNPTDITSYKIIPKSLLHVKSSRALYQAKLYPQNPTPSQTLPQCHTILSHHCGCQTTKTITIGRERILSRTIEKYA